MKQSGTTPDQTLREHVLHGIALNRTPGFHYPGFFLGLAWDRIDKSGARASIEVGPHCIDADGSIDIAAVALLADLALSSAMRAHLQPGVRMATVTMHLQFTGNPPSTDLVSDARLEAFTEHTSVPQGICRGSVLSGGRIVCYSSGTFVSPPPPPGVALSPLPWQRPEKTRVPHVEPRSLSADERKVVRYAERAIAASADGHSFIQHFWGQVPRAGEGAATNSVALGPHMTNRVGHAQGGVLVGIAVATAMAALPMRTELTGVSAWYLSPGEGARLSARSRVIQRGRNVSVVLTEIFGNAKKRVLEVVSSHSARKSSA